MNAVEMAMRAIMSNLSPEIQQTISQFGQIAVSCKAQLDRIEANQKLIMAALDVSTEGNDDVRRQLTDGSAGGDDGSGSAAPA